MENNITSNPIVPTYQQSQQNTVSPEEATDGISININVDQKQIENLLGAKFPTDLSKTPSKTFEGDIMYEGRFGNSLRFSSDLYNGEGQQGEPLTILANQAGNSLIEDINRDKASVYLTTNQKITINAANNARLDSFFTPPPPSPERLTPSQAEELATQSPERVLTSKNKIDLENIKSNKFFEIYDLEELGVYKDNNNQDTNIYKLVYKLGGYKAAIGEKLIEPFIKIVEAALEDGVKLIVDSGFRPPRGEGIPETETPSQEQLREENLLPKWVGKVDPQNPNLRKLEYYFKVVTAPAGESAHGISLGVDFITANGTNKAFRWLIKNADKYGFVRTVASEPWHWVYLPSATKFQYIPQNDPSWKGLA